MKKLLTLLLAAMMVLTLAACGSSGDSGPADPDSGPENNQTDDVDSGAPETLTIRTTNGDGEAVDVVVPYNPQRIAVMELATLDILDNIGMGDRVVGVSKGSSIDYLQGYLTDNSIANLGTIKEAALEEVMACEPDVIFIGGRLSTYYDALSEIAPVIRISTDVEIGLVESVRANATMIASLFGLEGDVADLMAGFDARIEALAGLADGNTAMIGMVTSGGFNVLGNTGRCSIIGVEIGFDNLGAADTDSTHGNESSFELLLSLNPDYIFVMDRDAAIGTEGAQLAQEIMENELVMKTDAYQNGNVVYLAHPAVWYTAEGGINALDVMLQDLEAGLIE